MLSTKKHSLDRRQLKLGVALKAASLLVANLLSQAVIAQPDLEGIWGIDPEMFSQYSTPEFTAEGQRRHDAYDAMTDDPSYGCVPSGLSRAWDEPDTSARIEQFEDRVVISYEMFDLVRTIELNQNGHPIEPQPSTANLDGVPMPRLGHSIGWYDGDALMIETIAYAAGYITTLRRFPPQSEALRSLERITRDDEDRLVVEITYVDPIIYTEPLTVTNRYYRSDFPFIVYGCVPSEVEGGAHQ